MIVVFLGPTLDRAAARSLLPDALYRPPARQGDIYRALREGARAIGLVDGVFAREPPVWHREILFALERGVPVAGAASLGALRAAELAPFGMQAVGKIAQAYLFGRYPPFADPFEDDDEVAVMHAPESLGWAPLSDAMVDLRSTLAAAETAGRLDATARDELARQQKALHFGERRFDRLVATARASLGDAAADGLEKSRVCQKRTDAEDLLRALAEGIAAPADQAFRMERALVWERFIETQEGGPFSADEERVLARLEAQPHVRALTRNAAAGRLNATVDAGPVDAAAFRQALDSFREVRGLASRTELERWMAANGLAERDFARLLRNEAALAAAADAAAPSRLRRAMLDQLRASGYYEALLRVAEDEPAQR